MPLLKKKTLEKTVPPDFLRDDEDVFHCVMTNEIFRDYEEFAERTILCNSMVWTCSLTGKTNLTYEEALQSEDQARSKLKDFPIELRIPILYLANLTKRTCFTDMSEDVCAFLKDHYFLGEIVEQTIGKKIKQYRVLKVIAPSNDDIKSQDTSANNNNDKRKFYPPGALYKYDIENLNTGEVLVVTPDQIHRKRKSFSDQKVKLFLKQYVEQGDEGFIIIKSSALDLYGINNINYSIISSGPTPDFVQSKDPRPKKVKQQTLAKFLSKNNIITREQQEEIDKKLKEKEELREQKLREKELLRKRNLEIQAKLREWNVPSEDLLLEDQKPLPEFTEVRTKIPDDVFGDALSIIDFMNTFAPVIDLKGRFRNGLTLEILERALLSELPEGPLIDLLLILMVAIFKCLEDERKQIGKKFKINMDYSVSDYSFETLKAMHANVWCLKIYGNRLTQLPLDSITLTEVLRLHLLASGARVSEIATKWRAANRGAYTSEEDPAIVFRIQNPHILKYLEMHNVVLLAVDDKVKIINCLINQLLTFKELRDVIDKEIEEHNTVKNEIKTLQANEKKRLQDFSAHVTQIKKSDVQNKQATLNDLVETNDKLRKQAEKAIELLTKSCTVTNTTLGYDRAYRRYVKLSTTRAIFINHEDFNVGECLPEVVPNIPELIDASDDTIKKYLGRTSEEMNTSDKENEPKEEKNRDDIDDVDDDDDKQFVKKTVADERQLLMCSSDPSTCIVHSNTNHRWSFILDIEKFDLLIDTLNKRGIRECDLLMNLKNNRESLSRVVRHTLNTDFDTEDEPIKFFKYENFGYTSDTDIVTALYRVTVKSVINLEEKLRQGNLGGIETKRTDWINLMNSTDFDNTHDLLRAKHKFYFTLDQESDEMFLKRKEYEDPALYLQRYLPDSFIDDDTNELLEQSDFEKKVIKFLATALAQVAFSVNPLCLGRPLGTYREKGELNENQEHHTNKDIMYRWEKSLMASTSFSQIGLHLSILDASILWKKSTFLVKCNTCNRGRDERNMILCDYCNDGYHIYCLKPKLNVVPTGQWFCENCKQLHEKEKKIKEEEEEDSDIEPEEEMECKVCGDAGYEDMISCSECPLVYHIDCIQITAIRRSLRGNWTCPECKDEDKKKLSLPANNGTRRNRDRKDNMPLNNVALQELLADVIKHKDAWPFTRPVQKNEVPDYYDIIAKPMDFGTIKYKLNMGEYKYDDEFMSDAKLIFENCNTYNNSQDEVYKCGVNLSKYFTKRCKELNLKLHDDFAMVDTNGSISNGKMNGDNNEDDYDEPKKKRRLK